MPFVASWPGFIMFMIVMLGFLVQEFSQGWRAPDGSAKRDDRWALLYLDALPVALVTISLAVSLIGWLPLPVPPLSFGIGIAVIVFGVALRQWSHGSLESFTRELSQSMTTIGSSTGGHIDG